MSVPETTAPPRNRGWLERIAPVGPIVFAAWLLIGFLASDDSGDSADEVIAYAKANEVEIGALLFLALATPVLIGFFVAVLAAKLRPLDDPVPRALTVLGGTGFIVFFTTAMTFWSAPLLENDEITTAAAESYLLFDDFGWVLLGASGICAGLMIIGVSLAAMRLRWGPPWLAWVSLVLGVLSFGTIAFLGMFAWIAWFILAGALMLWRGERLA